MKKYDIFVPLFYNDGTPIEPARFQRLQSELLTEFEGLTFFPQSNEGFWKMSGVTYRDEIVIYRVLTSRLRAARRFLSKLKERLKRELKSLAERVDHMNYFSSLIWIFRNSTCAPWPQKAM
ncbi:MAG TPA: hypothetical protein VMP01_11900 [Pirellulaceae bacterium]|nr:hypothetical protein [Pirellulaceae bacterium]